MATLSALFDHAVATAPETVALRHLDAVLTYASWGAPWTDQGRLETLAKEERGG